MTKIDSLLQIMDDELRWLRMEGERIYDAHEKEWFTLRVKLVRVRIDSRAFRQSLGTAKAGAKCACFLCKFLGQNNAFVRYDIAETANKTAVASEGSEDEVEHGNSDEEESECSSSDDEKEEDNVDEEESAAAARRAAARNPRAVDGDTSQAAPQERRQKEMRSSKMVYLGNFMFLPLVGVIAEYLRKEAAKLNDHPVGSNKWNSPAPERRKEEDMQAAAAWLKLSGIYPLPQQRRSKLREAAKKEAVVGWSPLLGSGMSITASNFDAMHAIANLALLLRSAILGYGMAEKITGIHFLKYEQEINQRFDGVIDMKTMVFVLDAIEKALVTSRNKLIHSGLYIHSTFTGGGFKNAFEEYTSSNKGMYGMSCEGHMNNFSPAGRYLLDGTLDRRVVGFENKELNFTYLDVVMALMLAINKLRMKETTKRSGKRNL